MPITPCSPRFGKILVVSQAHLDNHISLPPSECLTVKLTKSDKAQFKPLLDHEDLVYFQASGNEKRGWDCFNSSFLAHPGKRTPKQQYELAFTLAKKLSLPAEQKARLLKGIVQTAFYDGYKLPQQKQVRLVSAFVPKPVEQYIQERLVHTAMAGPFRASKRLQVWTHLADRVSFPEFRTLCAQARTEAKARIQRIHDAVQHVTAQRRAKC
jgi:hypothetical protein